MHDAKFLIVEDQVEDIIQQKETIKDKKLRDAFLKNRELQVLIEKERTEKMKLEGQLSDIQKQLVETQTTRSETQTERTDEQKDWKGKYLKMEKKLQEERLKATLLKNDLNKATRILQREVGEFKSLDELAVDDNAWKGRAQQIEILRGKVKDLQRMSKSTSDNFSVPKKPLGKTAESRRAEIEELKEEKNELVHLISLQKGR